MARILAIDYGTKRCGIAVSDMLKIIANPLDTVYSQELFPFLEKYIFSNEVEKILIGIPKNLKGKNTDATSFAIKAKQALEKKFKHIQVIEIDERFSSKIATMAIQQSGLGKIAKQNKGLVDKLSATYLLQEYLNK